LTVDLIGTPDVAEAVQAVFMALVGRTPFGKVTKINKYEILEKFC